MARPSQDVTDAELAVLEALWQQPGLATRELAEAVYGAGGASAYATVQKLLERLEAKGCVKRKRGVRVQTFHASIDRDELIGMRLQAMAEKLCGGSLTPLLTHHVRAERLSAAERQALRDLIEELDERTKRREK
jgi:predicted transcriptional regulator